MKQRITIPQEIVAKVMLDSDRTCCVCCERGKKVQIHHVDENPANNDINNLSVLCFDCHDLTMVRGGFGRSLTKEQVLVFRENWYGRVKKRRDDCDQIAVSRQLGDMPKDYGNVLVLDIAMKRSDDFSVDLLSQNNIREYIENIPFMIDRAHAYAQPKFDTGITSEMMQGGYDIIDSLVNIIRVLCSFFPSVKNETESIERFIDGYVRSKFIWHHFAQEPHGPGTGGTIVGQLVAGSVISELKSMIVDIVGGICMWDDEFEFVDWRKRVIGR